MEAAGLLLRGDWWQLEGAQAAIPSCHVPRGVPNGTAACAPAWAATAPKEQRRRADGQHKGPELPGQPAAMWLVGHSAMLRTTKGYLFCFQNGVQAEFLWTERPVGLSIGPLGEWGWRGGVGWI